MKKSIIALYFLLLATVSALAGPIDSATARQRAIAFLKAAGAGNQLEVNDITSSTPFTEFYVFTLGESGFVLVSGEEYGEQILGYSLTNRFEVQGMPQHIRSWLEGYEEGIRQLRAGGQPKGGGVAPLPVLSDVAPLLITTWNQNPYYNSLCPEDEDYGQRTVTGCVATATAQIMKYWNHPVTGYGSHSYTDNSYGTQSADFGATTYAWSTMPNVLSSGSTTAQVNAVATLMYHIGVGVEMNYGLSSTGGSGAHNYNSFGDISPSSQTALMKHFKYRPDMVTLARADYSDAEYALLLKAELDSSRPILFSGRDPNGGHSFVIDGYNSSNQFHINWGWGSYCDGYYTIGSLNPATGGTGGNNGTYNQDNVALVGIRPNGNFGTGGTVTATVSGTGGTVSGAGSYGFGDTVSLLATASPGYRFAGWTDHDRFNPKEFIGNGGDYNFTATFEPISGDTLSYCGNGRQITSYGLGAEGTCVWGIRLPASLLTAGHDLTAVQIYIPTEGTYTMTVYTGASVSSCVPRASSTATFTASDAAAWHTLTLDTTVAISGTQSVWIMFENSDADYPAAITYYGGRPEGCLWGGNMQEMAISFSFMIRGIFITPASPLPIPTVVVVSGPNTLEEGEPGTFRALANEDATVEWTLQGATPATGSGITVTAQWDTPGTYEVVATATTATGSASDTMQVTITPLPTFTITAESNDETMGTVEGGGTYPRGSIITLTAVPNEGYRFLRWHDGKTTPERQATVMANVTYTAYFAEQVGIDQAESATIDITPNPAGSTVTFHGVAGCQVQVIDMSGRVQAAFLAPHSTMTLDISQWPRGAYFVRVASAGESILKKLIVK